MILLTCLTGNFWNFCDGTYPLFTEYYKTNPGVDELIEKGGICDNKEESENDD